MTFIPVNGHRIYVEDTGGDGPVLIFSHGFILDHSMWDPTVAALTGEARCITWDERGHGMTECLGPFDFWDSASDLIGILDALGVDRAVAVGMSQGGFLTIRAALERPDRFEAVVLSDTAAGVDGEEIVAAYRSMQAAWEADGPVGEVATIQADLIFGPDFDATAWIGKWQTKAPSERHDAWNTVIERDDVSHRLGEIGCPTLVVNGTNDQAFGLDVARGICEGLGDCRGVVPIEGAAHAPPVSHPERFVEVLRTFLHSIS
jgi:3-oxoadipate enol-lactonase